jgi:hypothetical protein
MNCKGSKKYDPILLNGQENMIETVSAMAKLANYTVQVALLHDGLDVKQRPTSSSGWALSNCNSTR